MLHHTCDLCGQKIEDKRFVARLEVYPAFDPDEIKEEDLDRDNLSEISEMLADMELTGELNLDSAVSGDTDGSETLSITVDGLPDGATLTAGTDNGDGSWTLTSGELSGLTITPPSNDSDDFSLNVTATSTDGSDTAATTDGLEENAKAVVTGARSK